MERIGCFGGVTKHDLLDFDNLRLSCFDSSRVVAGWLAGGSATPSRTQSRVKSNHVPRADMRSPSAYTVK